MAIDFHDESEWDFNGGKEGDEQRPRASCSFELLFLLLCYFPSC